jgi:hypothetical protein
MSYTVLERFKWNQGCYEVREESLDDLIDEGIRREELGQTKLFSIDMLFRPKLYSPNTEKSNHGSPVGNEKKIRFVDNYGVDDHWNLEKKHGFEVEFGKNEYQRFKQET